jgi:hypothetical protein
VKNRLFQYFVITLLIGFLFNSRSFAQNFEVDNYRILYKFKTVKQNDNSRLLEISFIGVNKKNRKDKIPVFEAEIKFFNILNDQEIKLGIAKTDKKGIAQFILPENQSYLIDDEGYINFKALFEGTDALDEKEKKLAVKDIFLELDLTEVDSIKIVVLNAYTLDSLKRQIPVEEADVIFSVGGLFSQMPIEEATIEDGEYEFEFPTDIPGDVNGNLTVYSIIEDHEEFGNVNQKKTIKWGVFTKQYKEEKNMLWSEAAPIWMYVVLTIMLVGVWANYVYTIINLFKIKKEGVNLELESKL